MGTQMTCQICHAEVKPEYMELHLDWHQDIRDFINAGDRGWDE